MPLQMVPHRTHGSASYKFKLLHLQKGWPLRLFLLLWITLYSLTGLHAQFAGWSTLEDMPMPIANNAVCGFYHPVNGLQLFSFAGIDSTLDRTGITLASFRYDAASGWSTIPALPDTLGKVAAGCSVIDEKVYIIGGYHVFPGGSELSSDRVHIFDPATNTYLPDGAPIPVAIDDHVQAVWRDSLIYVVTGWSNTTNVADVQIYDPANDTWQVGTPVPNTSSYKVFGGSGVIHEDTIFYVGGARFGFNFPLGMVFRKGAIDPADPTNITWSDQMIPEALGYRMAAAVVVDVFGTWIAWIGGSTTSYNYDAIAYNGSGLVEPETRVIKYEDGNLSHASGWPPIMDLRGSFYTGLYGSSVYIAGGIGPAGLVSNKTYQLYPFLAGLDDFETGGLELSPSVSSGKFQLLVPEGNQAVSGEIYDMNGLLVFKKQLEQGNQFIDLENQPSGTYILVVRLGERAYQSRLVKVD